jgi:MFS superfamily sulfate permease-like transporter
LDYRLACIVQGIAGFLLTASPGFFLLFSGFRYMFPVLVVVCVLLIVGSHLKVQVWEPAKVGGRFGIVVLIVTFVSVLFASLILGIAAEP